MLRFVTAQWRRRPARALGLLPAVLFATTSFALLTGSTETGRLRTVGTVQANLRSAYDILVRPKGSTTELERTDAVVRQNFLSGIAGGITMAQYDTVRRLPGAAATARRMAGTGRLG
jgi:putative ABC transport system permease protein